MISKKFRLTERQTKKVLQKGKPFFSYGIVLNHVRNNLDYNRFSIVIGAKSVNNNVCRNFFRRRFFDFIKINNFFEGGKDYVFVIKKQTKLDKSDKKSIFSFDKDLDFLLNKVK